MSSPDYTKFRSSSDMVRQEAATAENASYRWWTMQGAEMAEAIAQTVDLLQRNQQGRMNQYVRSARLYGNMPAASSGKAAALAALVADGRVNDTTTQVAVDTAVAKVRKNRPKPYFLTNGGDFKAQRRAKRLNRFVDGVFYECRVPRLGPDAFRDGTVWGDGIVKVFARNKRVAMERTLPEELFVDELEAALNDPRSMYHVKEVDRHVLAETFPEHRDAIMKATSLRRDFRSATVSDLVTVREAWHLPSGPDAEDGRHVIALDELVLEDVPWTKATFPFARFSWAKRLVGYWGQGFVEQAQDKQIEVNKLTAIIRRTMQLAGTFKIFVPMDSRVDTAHFTNEPGTIIRHMGAPPVYVAPPILQGEFFQRRDDLRKEILALAGVTEMAARGQKPAGLGSGIAVREYKDETADRLATVQEAYEEFHLDLARLAIETVREIAKGGATYRVKSPDGKAVTELTWKDVDLRDSEYVMQCFPVSSLPTDPAGRLKTITEYVQAGMLTPRQGRRLLDFPDLEQVEGLQNAAEEYLCSILDRMVDEGEYTPPEPFDDLQLGRDLALEYYQRGKTQGLEEERLELLRRYIAQTDELAKQMNPPAPPPGDAGQPQAAPEAPPTSDLIPNAPGAAQAAA